MSQLRAVSPKGWGQVFTQMLDFCLLDEKTKRVWEIAQVLVLQRARAESGFSGSNDSRDSFGRKV